MDGQPGFWLEMGLHSLAPTGAGAAGFNTFEISSFSVC